MNDLDLFARRVITVIEPDRENAIQFVKEAAGDKASDNFLEWEMIEEYFLKIRALPGAAHAFRYLLKNANAYRVEARKWWPGLVTGRDV